MAEDAIDRHPTQRQKGWELEERCPPGMKNMKFKYVSNVSLEYLRLPRVERKIVVEVMRKTNDENRR